MFNPQPPKRRHPFPVAAGTGQGKPTTQTGYPCPPRCVSRMFLLSAAAQQWYGQSIAVSNTVHSVLNSSTILFARLDHRRERSIFIVEHGLRVPAGRKNRCLFAFLCLIKPWALLSMS